MMPVGVTCVDMEVNTHTRGTQTRWTQLCAALSQAHATRRGGDGPGWKSNELDPSFLCSLEFLSIFLLEKALWLNCYC